MLILARRNGESVDLDLGDGRKMIFRVIDVGNGNCRLGFEAPQSVRIWRSELPPLVGSDSGVVSTSGLVGSQTAGALLDVRG